MDTPERHGGDETTRGPRPTQVAPVAAAILLVLLAWVIATRQSALAVAGTTAADGALGTIETRLAVSHIRVEELIAGDRTVDAQRDVLGNQADAARLCRVLREGGPTRYGEIEAVGDDALDDRTARLCTEVETFRELTAQRLRAPEATRAGSAAETRYDDAFSELLRTAESVRTRLVDIAASQRRRGEVSQVAVVLVLLVVVATAAVALRRRDRQATEVAGERSSTT
jgi:hypothetical protein